MIFTPFFKAGKMVIKNIDCKQLVLSSPEIKAAIQEGGYKKLEIKLTKNCCTSQQYTSEIDLDETPGFYVTAFNTDDEDPDNDVEIMGIYVKNLVTGVEYNVISPFNYSDWNCTNDFGGLGPGGLYELIESWFTGNLLAAPTQTSSADVAGRCTLSYTDLPANFIFTRMAYTVNGETYIEQFSYTGSTETLFASGDDVYILPSLISSSLSVFPDGVYTVDITITKSNNSVITDRSCLFADCETRCKVADKLDTIKTSTDIHLMYFALTESANCGCQCESICELYRKLTVELGLNPLTSGCDC